MPIVPSYAWKVYGINWVQLDAPRHLYIYSLQGVKILLAKTHLLLMKVEYDSTEFQFIGSEQYKMDIPLWSQKSYYVKPGKSLFRKSDIKRYRSFSKELNLRGEGDMVCMYLHKSLNHQVIC
jgi:hypothetical protein